MTENTRTTNQFEYRAEDLDCQYCLHTKCSEKVHENGCLENSCRFEDIRKEAADSGRTARSKGNPRHG